MNASTDQQGLRGWTPNAPPSDALVFKFPAFLVWTMLFGALFFLGFLLFDVVMQFVRPARGSLAIALAGVVVFGSLAALALRCLSRFRDRIAVNSDGVWDLPRKSTSKFISWCDVASVRANDTQQRLVLIDTTGQRKIRLEYQLENFGRLREFVLAHTAASTRLPDLSVTVFHRTWINKGILLCFTLLLFVGGLSLHGGSPGASLVFLGVAVYVFAMIVMLDPTRVVIRKDAVVIQYLGRKRTIPYNSISGIVLTDTYSRGNVWATVIVKRLVGRPLKLFRFREGSIALHDALESAWKSAQAHASS